MMAFLPYLRRRRGDGIFVDVTKQAGINSSSIGYGLGVVAADINLMAILICISEMIFMKMIISTSIKRMELLQDENDQHLMHTSKFSMGVDVADVNNDGNPEIISMDMLPSDPYILKRSLGDDEYDIFLDKISTRI